MGHLPLHVTILCAIGLTLTCSRRIVGIRGMAPAKWPLIFDADGFYICNGGTKRIRKEMVNDGFCDCSDLSDEPGTSACAVAGPSVSSFFCLNIGFKGTAIPSSRVNDGLCDCCDGSDEWKRTDDKYPPCLHSCASEIDSDDKDGDQVDLKGMREGAQARRLYIEQARAVRASDDKAFVRLEPGAYGAEDAYFALEGQCFNIKSGVFTYSVCPFSNATQHENEQEPILIGTWARLAEQEDGGGAIGAQGWPRMYFTEGAPCSKQLNRTLTVHLTCGPTNYIIRESEPSMCNYVMTMQTPAACNSATLAEVNLDVNGDPVQLRLPDSGGLLTWFGLGAATDEADEIVYHNEL